MVRSLDSPDLVVVDFGLSFNEDAEEESLTHTGEQLRNRFLALPESTIAGDDRRDKRSDVTALAAILSFCLTGHEPGQLRDSKGRPPHRRPGFSIREALGSDPRREALEVLLDRAFSVEVEHRFQSVSELENRLRAILMPSRETEEDPGQVAQELNPRPFENRSGTRRFVENSPLDSWFQTDFGLARDLRARDRKTWVAGHKSHAQGVLAGMCQQAIQRKHEFLPFAVAYGNGSPVALALPAGLEMVADSVAHLSVSISPHAHTCFVMLAVAARGNQCVLLRALAHRDGASQGTVVGNWEEMAWYDPDGCPSFDGFTPVARSGLSLALRHLHRIVMDGQG